MNIVFGDCVALGGHCYALVLVDVATIYCCLYGILFLYSTSITSSLENFSSEAVQLPKRFHSKSDRNIIGGKCTTLDPC